MAGSKVSALVLMSVAALALAGCQDGMKPFSFLKKKDSAAADQTTAGAAPQQSSVKLVDRDVEAPDVFQVSAKGLWDGRPSLGGVWVAYPGVNNPERVIIRNPANGKFVIGALFRRENNNPGPKLQLSSDAATALGLYAGEPATVSVTALRRQDAPVAAPNAKEPALAANEQITAKPLSEVAATASAAIDKSQGGAKAGAASPQARKPMDRPAQNAARPAEKIARAEAPLKATGGRDYLQIGIFSVEENAKRAAKVVSKAGSRAYVRAEESHDKTFWRVVAGPATTSSARDALLAKVKKLGFADAYFVTQ